MQRQCVLAIKLFCFCESITLSIYGESKTNVASLELTAIDRS